MLALRLYRFVLRLPRFRGHSRLQELVRSTFFRPWLVSVDHGLRLDFDPWEWNQVHIFRDGCIEPKTLTLYRGILSSGDVYVDVGAHIGLHALVASTCVGGHGRIIAVEPQPYNCNKILANFRGNGFSNVLVVVAVAGNRTGTVALHDQVPRDKSRLSLALDPVNDEPQQFQVPTLRLDDVLKGAGITGVRLVKIDVEGFEAEVIEGMSGCLSAVENIVLEVLPENLESDKTRHLVRELEGAGFGLRTVENSPWTCGDPLPENNLWATRVP